MSAIRSMTGFARVRKNTPAGELVLSIKSVNHRGLDVQFRMGPELDPFENAMRAAVGRRVARGHLEIRVVLHRDQGGGAGGWNRTLLEAYLGAFQEAALQHGLEAKPDLNAAFRVPGMFGEAVDAELVAEFEGVLLAAFEEVLDQLNAFREREGGQIASLLGSHNTNISRAAVQMEQLRTGVVPLLQARLAARVGELLAGAAIDPQRLAQEAAILADRSDIGEEMTRLKIHCEQLAKLLDGGGEIGKKMDFLLQEMHRETNTILSKSNGAGEAGLRLTDLALSVKSEIEKIREQALNLE